MPRTEQKNQFDQGALRNETTASTSVDNANMERQKLINTIWQMVRRTLRDPSPHSEDIEMCHFFEDDEYDFWVETMLSGDPSAPEILTVEQIDAFNEHVLSCRWCSKHAAEAYDRHRRLAASASAGELGKRRMMARIREHRDRLLANRPHRHGRMLLAASREKPRKSMGIAYAVAVFEEFTLFNMSVPNGTWSASYELSVSDHPPLGTLMECIAMVGPAGTSEEPCLKLRGKEIIKLRQGGMQYTTSSTLENLTKDLEDLFSSEPCLEPFQLNQRCITVSFKPVPDDDSRLGPKPIIQGIVEGYSLELAILVAILNAITQTALPETVFSAHIHPVGTLRKVGDAGLKAIVAHQKGKKTIYFAEGNRTDIENLQTDRKLPVAVVFRNSISDVINDFDYYQKISPPPTENNPPSQQVSPPPSVHSGRARAFIFEAAERIGVAENLVDDASELAEDLCQRQAPRRGGSSCLLVGHLDGARRQLTDAPLALDSVLTDKPAKDIVPVVAPFIDGTEFCMLVDEAGKLSGIAGIGEAVPENQGGTHLLTAPCKRMAALSSIGSHLVFTACTETRSVLVFADGALIGGYFQGVWRRLNCNGLAAALSRCAADTAIDAGGLDAAGKAAIAQASRMKSKMFVFIDSNERAEALFHFLPHRAGITVNPTLLRLLPESELLSLASRINGGLAIDRRGYLIGVGAQPKSDVIEAVISAPSTNPDLLAATHLSDQIKSVVLVSTSEGAVYLIVNGKLSFSTC